ncbi:hypothetical protein PsYK624_056460 [Phanerochaete sordida]|uniref:Uncharacterized protein n=1 Tax=Phanerochaete sordida TaxID=48140 RepID=A0A9P3G757_9APHY|nr:hypothetical protein PsYK624_056460 [Phanerochaete sordida]
MTWRSSCLPPDNCGRAHPTPHTHNTQRSAPAPAALLVPARRHGTRKRTQHRLRALHTCRAIAAGAGARAAQAHAAPRGTSRQAFARQKAPIPATTR